MNVRDGWGPRVLAGSGRRGRIGEDDADAEEANRSGQLELAEELGGPVATTSGSVVGSGSLRILLLVQKVASGP